MEGRQHLWWLNYQILNGYRRVLIKLLRQFQQGSVSPFADRRNDRGDTIYQLTVALIVASCQCRQICLKSA
jgi:hypothetical protein